MFHSRRLNNHINNTHERALRIVYRDRITSIKDLLKKDQSVTIHHRNLQILATEIFKTKYGLNPGIKKNTFNFIEAAYHLRSNNRLERRNVKSVRYGTETTSQLGPKIWKNITKLIHYLFSKEKLGNR